MTLKIIINGARGKMGSITVAAIAYEKDFQCVAALEHKDDLAQAIKKHKPDVVIDWTLPACVFDNTQKIIEAGARPVIGTTGLTPAQIEILSQQCQSKKLGAIIAPNFSIGAILMMKYAQDAAKYFSNVEIIEYHHPQKLDAPSGTAKITAELIAKNKKQKNTSADIDAELKNNLARGARYCEIPIHSLRLPGIFANQQVIFGSNGETFTLKHEAIDRNAIMPGLFLCCRKVMTLNHLVYGMESLI